MEQQRFIETGNHSFYGEYLYDQVIPADHFLRKLTSYGLYEEMYSSSIPSARLLTGILNNSLIQVIHPS